MKLELRLAALLAALVIACAAAPAVAADPAPAPEGGASLSDLNKKLTNPVSDIWSLTFQQNNLRVDPGPGVNDRWSTNLLFQPVLPIAISDDWNLVTRPVIPLFASNPHPRSTRPAEIGRSTAFGDTTLLQLVSPSPNLVGSWLLGLGPTWQFPTAGSDFTGSGRWQVGPAAIVGYLSEKWILGALFQSWWSFSDSVGGDRPSAASMNLQPVAAYFLPDGWSIGYSGNILANWKNRSSDGVYTVPIGLAVAKVAKLGKVPVKFALAGQWMPVQPDFYGQRWNIQLQVTPVIPKLVKGNLIHPSSMSFGLGQ